MINKIYEVQKELDKDFYLYGYTSRIAVYGPRLSARRHIGKRKIAKDPRIMTKGLGFLGLGTCFSEDQGFLDFGSCFQRTKVSGS